jgi:hypothetical protein
MPREPLSDDEITEMMQRHLAELDECEGKTDYGAKALDAVRQFVSLVVVTVRSAGK